MKKEERAERVKQVIETYGGSVRIFGKYAHITSQPTAFQGREISAPIWLSILNNVLTIRVSNSYYPLARAKVVLEQLQLAVKIVSEIEEMS